MNRARLKNRHHSLLILVGFSILSACSSKSPPEQAQPLPSPVVQEAVVPTDLPPATSTAIPAFLPTEAEMEQIVEKPRVKTNIQASNPNEVSLVNGRPTFVEFFAFWCPICQALAPVVHELEAEYFNKIDFIYLDIDNRQTDSFKRTLGYRFQPHLFLLDGQGNITQQWVGYASQEELKIAFDLALE